MSLVIYFTTKLRDLYVTIEQTIPCLYCFYSLAKELNIWINVFLEYLLLISAGKCKHLYIIRNKVKINICKVKINICKESLIVP